MECWKQHFSGHGNAEFPQNEDALDDIGMQLEVKEGRANVQINHEEAKRAVGYLKLRKAPGGDGISAEVLKAGGNTMARVLNAIINKVWKEEVTSTNWAKMVVSLIHKKGASLNPLNYKAIALTINTRQGLLEVPGGEDKTKD